MEYKKLTLKDFGVKREEKTLNNSSYVVLYEKIAVVYESLFLTSSRFDLKKGCVSLLLIEEIYCF
jgi:hypothetical protein